MNTKIVLIFSFLIIIQIKNYSQTVEYKDKSIIGGVGVGLNGGEKEEGIGIIYSIGWQKNISKNERLRINPNLIFGGFSPLFITDTRDQFYRISSFGVNLNYDLIKFDSFSFVTTAGGFVNYSRGLLGTGGWPSANNKSSEYFHSLYFGVNTSLAFRFENQSKNKAVELRPLSFQFGNNESYLGYMMVAMDFKLKK